MDNLPSNDARAKAQAKLERLLLLGLEGEVTEWTEADWEALIRRAGNLEAVTLAELQAVLDADD